MAIFLFFVLIGGFAIGLAVSTYRPCAWDEFQQVKDEFKRERKKSWEQ